jgi:hypothetical protein
MPKPDPEVVVAELVAAKGQFSLSLHRILMGGVQEFGGPEELGKWLVKLMKDDEVPIPSRVSLANNFTRLIASTTTDDEEDDNELFNAEQIKARLNQLQ